MNRQMDPDRRIHAGLIPGIILVGIGALFFLNNLNIFYVRDFVRFWPAILVAIGIVKLVDSTETPGRVGGGVLIGVGAILLAQTLGYLDGLRTRDMWPLILIAVGVFLLFQRGFQWPEMPVDTGTAANVLNVNSAFGGVKRNVVTEDFRGGRVSTVFGGVELNLRKARIAGDAATLHVDAVFGGVEIKVPENWSVVIRGSAVFGGYQDDTVQPREDTPGFKRLFLTGSAVFGGVEVKN